MLVAGSSSPTIARSATSAATSAHAWSAVSASVNVNVDEWLEIFGTPPDEST